MGEMIRRRRMAMGISQGRLAKLMNVTQGSVSQWEKGLTHPKVESLPKLAFTLGVSIDELIWKQKGKDENGHKKTA